MALASVVANAAVFLSVFVMATARRLTVADVAPGAVAAAVLWQLLQTFGVAYVDHVVKGAGAANGVFALVLGMLAFLSMSAVAVVGCVEVNVVRVDRLHPRSLFTPFTDAVELIRATAGRTPGRPPPSAARASRPSTSRATRRTPTTAPVTAPKAHPEPRGRRPGHCSPRRHRPRCAVQRPLPRLAGERLHRVPAAARARWTLSPPPATRGTGSPRH